MRIEIDGRELHVRRKGQGRRAALFIHPYLLDSTFWLDQLGGLADLRTCYAPDLPGHGESEPTSAATVDPERDAALLDALVADLRIEGPIDLVGASAGGILAGLMVERAPERYASLTLLSTNFAQGPDARVQVYQREMARLAVVEGHDALFRRWDEYIVGSGVTLHARARYKSMLSRCRVETIVAFLTSETLKERPHLPGLFRCPVLLPYGDEDVVMKGELGEKNRALYPDARLVRVEKAARLLPLENPAALNAAIRAFWEAPDAL